MSINSILQIIAADRRVISYRPELTKIIGSVNATILFQQIMFRWTLNNQKEFYKYKEPCQARHYRVGDSWTEELGFTRREFDGALKILVDLDVVNYRVDIERKTWYSLNEEKSIEIINKSYPEKAETVSRKGGNVLYEKEETDFTNGHIPPFDHNTEITTKITTDITAENAAPAPNQNPLDNVENQQQVNSELLQDQDFPTLINGFKEEKEKVSQKRKRTPAAPTPIDAALQDAIWAFVQSDPYWRGNKLCKTPTAAFKLATTTSNRERGLMSQFLDWKESHPTQINLEQTYPDSPILSNW